MKRRTFLKGLAATAAATPIMINGIPVRGQTPLKFLAQMPQFAQGKIFIFVQLFGGNDGLNTVIPVTDTNYLTLRPNIGIQTVNAIEVEPNLIYFNPGLGKGAVGGFVAGLQGTQGPAWLGVMQGVGYPNPNLSHFRSTDIWLSGLNPPDSTTPLDTGWVGRMLEKNYPSFPANLPDDPLAIQLGGFSLTLMGADATPTGIQVGDPSKQTGVSSNLDTLDTASAGTNYATEYAFVEQVAIDSNKYATNIQNAYAAGKPKLTSSYGSDGFSQQMAITAALIAGGLQTSVYVVSLGGFDTHVQQQSVGDTTQSTGTHPTLLGQLADGVAEFVHDMIKLGLSDDIIGMTVSEFGRRPSENGSYGTDHGASSVQFVWGTQVNAAMYGNVPDLGTLDENQNTELQTDYRSIYLSVMTQWFGMTLADAMTVLELNANSGVQPVPGLIKPQAGVSQAIPSPESGVRISNYPNPFSQSTQFQLVLPNAANVTFNLSNIAGEQVMQVFEKRLEAGTHQIPFSANLPSGVYLCSLIVNGERISHLIECKK